MHAAWFWSEVLRLFVIASASGFSPGAYALIAPLPADFVLGHRAEVLGFFPKRQDIAPGTAQVFPLLFGGEQNCNHSPGVVSVKC